MDTQKTHPQRSGHHAHVVTPAEFRKAQQHDCCMSGKTERVLRDMHHARRIEQERSGR